MYMGVIPCVPSSRPLPSGAPHVYGGDPKKYIRESIYYSVLPMYMGVILRTPQTKLSDKGAPHVYGGDPVTDLAEKEIKTCSPCIWG